MEHYHQSCLVCGSPDFGVMNSEYEHAHLVKCTKCDFVFCSRIPSAAELNVHYDGYPRGTSLSQLTIKRYLHLLEQFEPYRKTNRILDIGCGDGHFLSVAKSKGWEVFGTEFTEGAAMICTAKGIDMHVGLIQSFSTAKAFDVITSFEVLEHINDGAEHVRKIQSLLRPGGLFYFTTPNFNALSRRILGGKWKNIEYPEHLSYYTAATVRRLLVDAGLLHLSINTTGIELRRKQKTEPVVQETNLREQIEENQVLRTIKSCINGTLNLLRLGDTLKGYYVKP